MDVTVPMAAKIVNLLVQVDDKVKENDQVATLEALKMEMPVMAPLSCSIKKTMLRL
jgi:acetyl-CoA carboxylase biotin carboxyl carrier protein